MDDKQIEVIKFILTEWDPLGEQTSKVEDYAIPGMQLIVVSQEGDTIMHYEDLYANNSEGLNFSPLLLQTNITTTTPIHSNKEYTVYVNIWDKNGEGTFNTKMDFDVVPNSHIDIESNAITYDEIYLFSEPSDAAILDNNVRYNEMTDMIFEGLDGFTVEDGIVYIWC